MANLLQKTIQRSTFPSLSMEAYAQFFDFGGLAYPFTFGQTIQGHVEEANGSFEGLIYSAFKSNGIVFACMMARMMAFSEARFQFRQRTSGRPGNLFGNADLSVLEHPWPGGVTADLLSRAIQDVDLAGNFFAVRRPNRIRRLRPDWVTIILGSMEDPDLEAGDIDAEVVGYIYHPGGRGSGREPVFMLREQVAHFAPIPDPAASFRGMSWLLPIIREFTSDTAMTMHKQAFLEHGATPNMVVTLDASIKKEAFKEWVAMFADKHEGVANAYKTLYLGAGSTMTPVGKDFRQMDFAVTQAAGELRIAAAAGVPATMIGLSEALKGSSLNSGNYMSSMRRFADLTMRPLWRNMSTSLQMLVNTPAGAELWYDDRDIPFLFEDFKDRALVQKSNTASIRQLIDGGFDPKSVVDAVMANDLSRLVHTGLVSVQLQPPGTVMGAGGHKFVQGGPNEPGETPKATEKPPAAKPKAEAKSRDDAPWRLPAPGQVRLTDGTTVELRDGRLTPVRVVGTPSEE